MNTNRLAGFLAVMVFALLAADSADAFYHAGMGRFLNRDPSGSPHVRLGGAYSPSHAGNFIQRDTLAATSPQHNRILDAAFSTSQYTDGYNLYRYVQSNPTGYRDPSGLVRDIVLTFPGHTFIQTKCDNKCVQLHFSPGAGGPGFAFNQYQKIDCKDFQSTGGTIATVPLTPEEDQALCDKCDELGDGDGVDDGYPYFFPFNTCWNATRYYAYDGRDDTVQRLQDERRDCMAKCCGPNGCRGASKRVCSRRCSR